jgi:hypothetical protein
MLGAFFFFVAIEGGCVIMRSLVDLSRETTRDIVRRDPLFRRSINFHAITRAQHKSFGTASAAQNTFRLAMAGKPLARLYVRGVMTEPNAEQIHGSGCV